MNLKFALALVGASAFMFSACATEESSKASAFDGKKETDTKPDGGDTLDTSGDEIVCYDLTDDTDCLTYDIYGCCDDTDCAYFVVDGDGNTLGGFLCASYDDCEDAWANVEEFCSAAGT